MKKRLLKRGKIKRALAMMLVFVMTLSLANGIVFVGKTQKVKAGTINQFIADGRWKSGIAWSAYQGPKLSGWRSSGCCAYCADYTRYVYGITGWGGNKFNSVSQIRAGDVVHFYGMQPNGYYSEHWMVVISRSGNTLRTAEGNMAGRTNVTSSRYSISGSKILIHAYGRTYQQNLCEGYHFTGKPTPNNNNYKPEGRLDAAVSSPGTLYVRGWAKDRDNLNKKITVHVYVGDTARKGTTAEVFSAKADVKCNNGIGNYYFEKTFNIKKKFGKQKVTVYGINIDKNGKGGGDNPPLQNPITLNIKKKIDYKINTDLAANIKNKDASISGTISDNGKASKWGFHCGTNSGSMTKYTVSTATSSSSTLSTKIAPYVSLTHGTTYYYKMWAVVDGKEITDASPKSFTTTSLKPEIPTLKVASGSQEMGIESAATVNWNEVDNADYYILKLYDSEGNVIHESDKVTGTKYAFPASEKAGEYTCTISAYSDVGTKGESESVSYTVHPDVKVKFIDADSFVDVEDDYEPAVISEQDVHWGSDALKPTDPEHTGYTFKQWDKDFTKVKENVTLKAVYEINKYTVKYVDSLTGNTLDTKLVEYYSPAPDVEYDIATGYKRIGFDGWDKDHSKIVEDTVLYTCVGWYNNNFSVITSVKEAEREYDSEESDNEGYTIITEVKSNPDKTAKGRLVVALKTSEGKLLTSTESSAFSIKKDSTKELEVFVPYDKAAKQVEVFVVNQYGLAIPISNSATKEINQSKMFTNWSTEEPEGEVYQLESRTEYRYSDKETVKSYDSSIEGYTLESSAWVQSGSGSINYVSSFPSGFNKSSSYYTSYNKKPVTAYENTTNKRTVTTSTKGYLYFHWCKGRTNGPASNVVSDCYETTYPKWHVFESSKNLGYDSSKGATYSKRSDICKDSYWWDGAKAWSSATTQVKTCKYTDYRKQYTLSRWKDFSDWSTNEYTASDTRRVENRQVYRYIDPDNMREDNSGEERTVEGSLGTAFAGQEATLFIYKVDEASDYTNEYVAQTVLDDEGNYTFHFKLREEPTVKTGDFTIALGVEGGSTAINIGTIEAPKNKYTVRFFNAEGEVISTQEVIEGENAEIPDSNLYEKKGYTFTNWTATNVNIKSDVDIHPEYKINKYNVVFVDWAANAVDVQEFEYGAPLVTPLADSPEEGKTVSWEILSGIEEGDDSSVNGSTTVTNNLVVGTVYTDKEYQVQIQDEKNRVVDTKTVKYGKAVLLPEQEDEQGKIFLGWEDTATGEELEVDNTIVSDNMIVCPVYTYSETVEEPIATVKTGVYNSKQMVELSTDTQGASIYYTLDGKDPTTANGILYEGPIEINSSIELNYYAAKIGMNNSNVQTEYYSVNKPNTKSKWLTFDELPEEVKENPDSYNVESADGYSYKNTKTVTTLTEASELEDSGWIYDESLDSYTDYTPWKNIRDDYSTFFEVQEDEPRDILEETSSYRYTYYSYIEDGEEKYSRTDIEGKDCTEKELIVENKLKISGFEDGKAYYVYDGHIWYNQEEVVSQKKVDTEYRYRIKKATYYKWSDYTVDKPSVDESRDYKKDDVYCYDLKNKYLITIIDNDGNKFYDLVEEDLPYSDFSSLALEEGKYLSGLYTDSDFENEFDCESPITNDLTLYAKIETMYHEVSFSYGDREEPIDIQMVEYGKSANPPEVEERQGYRFVGWDSEDYKEVKEITAVVAKYVKEEDYATVELDNEAVTLYQDKSIDLTASVTPNTYDGGLTWESSDTSIASVSEDGKVTAHNPGIANITVRVNETGETATCKVSVKTDINSKIVLLKNSKLRIDDNGFLREIRAGSNTVAEITNDFENDSLIVKDAEGNVLEDTDVVGTGSIIYLMKGKNIVDQMEVVVVGDTTGDGYVNNRDVSKLVRCLIDKEVPTDAQILAGDVNGDGYFNNRDAALIARSLVGKEVL